MTRQELIQVLRKEDARLPYEDFSFKHLKARCLINAKPLKTWTKKEFIKTVCKRGRAGERFKTFKLAEIKEHFLKNVCGSYFQINFFRVDAYLGIDLEVSQQQRLNDLFY
jgi:hypothetical protein